MFSEEEQEQIKFFGMLAGIIVAVMIFICIISCCCMNRKPKEKRQVGQEVEMLSNSTGRDPRMSPSSKPNRADEEDNATA